ncbi:KTSC domain-containing protein [Paludibacterium sp.]|uniref:KTSC domain-containing protein n=1 Tax=Paludibacterium sp. TaxID=1917523 RepID=UPI0025FF3AA2|nr:KTSC domain-containing protein [Paludibacterium sp.]MBV8646369.1 KTSC domain-containing protein [Paludibacterium sp.]
MEMKRLNAGKLRAVGYDRASRTLRVELDDGKLLDYSHVGESLWQRLVTSAAAWSFYRDNIEDQFSCKLAARGDSGPKANPLDELFGRPEQNRDEG